MLTYQQYEMSHPLEIYNCLPFSQHPTKQCTDQHCELPVVNYEHCCELIMNITTNKQSKTSLFVNTSCVFAAQFKVQIGSVWQTQFRVVETNMQNTENHLAAGYNLAAGYASQHIRCLSQARINREGCVRKGIRHKMVGMAEVGAPISQDGVAVHPDCCCLCLCYLHFAPIKSRRWRTTI